MREKILDLIGDQDAEVVFVDGYDDCIIGYEPLGQKIVYSRTSMVNLLMEEGMEELDAMDHLEFNVFNTYVGEHTPLFVFESWEIR